MTTRTYGGRRGAAEGALDYRDLAHFDDLTIKKLKQLKRDTSSSYATWSNHPQRSVRKTRKKVLRRVVKIEPSSAISGLHTSPTCCITPDKSLRVNRAPDPFDQLLAETSQEPLCVRRDDNDLFSQSRSESSENKWLCESAIKNDPKLNLTHHDESRNNFDSIKQNKMNGCNSSAKDTNLTHNNTTDTTNNLQTSNMCKYKLKVELKVEEKNLGGFSNSIHTLLTDSSFLNAMKRKKLQERRNNCSNIENNSTSLKHEPQTSTPIFQRKNKTYSMNVSPICNNKRKILITSIIKASPLHENKDIISNNIESNLSDNNCSVKDVEVNNLMISIDMPEEAILKSSSTGCKYYSEYHNKSVESMLVDSEPFLGFTNVDATDNDSGTGVANSNTQRRNESRVESDAVTNDTSMNEMNELQKECIHVEKSLNSFSSESNENDSYGTCSSNNASVEGSTTNAHVCIDQVNDSLPLECYKNMNNCHDVSGACSTKEDTNTLSEIENSIESSVELNKSQGIKCTEVHSYCELQSPKSSINTSESNVSSVSSVRSQLTVFNANEDIYRESISISSDSSSDVGKPNESRSSSDTSSWCSSSTNSSSSKTSSQSKISVRDERMASFVTTRRRNDFVNDSVTILLDDSSEDLSAKRENIANDDNLDKDNCSPECIIWNKSIDIERDHPRTGDAEFVPDLNQVKIVQNELQTSIISPTKVRQNAFNYSDDVASNTMQDNHIRPSIALLPGKKWERSLSLYRRQTVLQEYTLQEDTIHEASSSAVNRESLRRESIICKLNVHDTRGTLYLNDSVCEGRQSILCNPRRSTIRIVKEVSSARLSLSGTSIVEDDIGFLSENCDDTLRELSKLSISDARLDVTVLEKRKETSARDVVLRRCEQTDALPFHECYPDSVLKNCHKIGEGVYGEVYLYRGQDGRGRVMKVVPVEGQLLVNGEHQKTFEEVISEVVIAMELSALRAPIAAIEKHCDAEREIYELDLSTVENATDTFNEVLAVRCVFGAYPARLLDLWDLYDEAKGSENDNPDALPPDQLYMVLELANAGQDLESYQFNSAEQAHALFYQIAFALAVGEEAYQFEHRDLHWGNVLIQPTEQKFARFVLRGRLHSVARCGVAATIIDYTLSRVSLPLAAGERAALYNDLGQDEGLFHAVGDYQFEVYRHMRDKTGNDWKKFEPYTNVLWLHYTVDKMITALRYKRVNTKIHKHYIAKLKGIKNRLLDYGSAVQFVLTDNEH